jgi:hypothetical protein
MDEGARPGERLRLLAWGVFAVAAIISTVGVVQVTMRVVNGSYGPGEAWGS